MTSQGESDRSRGQDVSGVDTSRGAGGVVGDCAIYEAGRRRPGRVSLAEAGHAARSGHGFVWIGLQEPTATDIAEVAAQFQLPPLAVEGAVLAQQRPKLEVYDDVVLVVLKPVRYVNHEQVVEVSEIALFVGPNFVVTVRHGDNDVLRRVRAELEAPDAADSGAEGHVDFGPTTVLYRAADLVVDGYEEAIEYIDLDVDDIESQVFGPGENDHAERIYKLKREVLEFRRAAVPLVRPLELLVGAKLTGVDNSAAPYFRVVLDHALRACERVESLDRLLTDVLQANVARVTVGQSAIALRQNEDVRKISAWAAIALVPTAIAGIYGMNFDYMPELRWHYGYFAVIAITSAACFALYRLFRRNGWL